MQVLEALPCSADFPLLNRSGQLQCMAERLGKFGLPGSSGNALMDI